MAKLVLLLATFALVLFLSNASIYRTTITVDSEETRGRQERSCQQQIRKQNYLTHCREYMEEQCSSHSRPAVSIEPCCEQLKKLDTQCQCTGLKQAVERLLEEGELGREEQQEMYEVAERVMRKCEMEPRMCDMQSRNWF
ncbi:2S sulfur-rich seed storage protein 2-like [Durio zibethinus]|uniref:2S sulfur-rich seed storage protein 2-like n=1 Tax=Durio zibethinus TaxID=66656 RepID=A0A6P5Y3R2_DURZI|nr:2S sulfur-rich seed storage protein 2-like [Durio zibethinus]